MPRKTTSSKKPAIPVWLYKSLPLSDEQIHDFPEQYEAFVYIMVHSPSGKRYIGKKNFHSVKTVKGSRKKQKTVSNWLSYFSSSDDIKELTRTPEDKLNWKREIIYLCKEQKYANYLEVKLQFQMGCLEDRDKWFNSNINGLWYSSWFKDIKEGVADYD